MEDSNKRVGGGHCGGDVEECWRDLFFCRFHASAIASTSNNVVVVFSFISSVGKRRHQQKGSCKQIFFSPVRSQRWSSTHTHKYKKMLFGLLFCFFFFFTLSVQKEKDQKTRALIIFISQRRRRCNRFTIQMGGGKSTHSRSIGKKNNKTVHGTSRLFSNNERAKFLKNQNLKIIIRFFFEFLALKMIIVFCQSTLRT